MKNTICFKQSTLLPFLDYGWLRDTYTFVLSSYFFFFSYFSSCHPRYVHVQTATTHGENAPTPTFAPARMVGNLGDLTGLSWRLAFER